MDQSSLIARLSAMPLFAGLTQRELQEVAGTVLERKIKAGKPIIKEGNWGYEVVLVLDGEIDVVRDGKVVDSVGPGNYVGEMAVLKDVRRNASVVAKTAVVYGTIDAGLFRSLIWEIPVLAERIAADVPNHSPRPAPPAG